MQNFIIQSNNFLEKEKEIKAFYHSDYTGGAGQWRREGTVENIICTLKNDITPFSEIVLQNAVRDLSSILSADLPKILQEAKLNSLTVCVVPRAKTNYQPNQLLFKTTVGDIVNKLDGFIDGTGYIIRHTDTRTTHRDRAGYGGNGDLPYPEITKNTCNISNEVRGKNILLIDDLYTETINIDEDAIQALLDNGAKSVIFYAVGKNIHG